jgi:hypothetical protein
MELHLNDPAVLPSILNSLPPRLRSRYEQALKSCRPELQATWDSLYWMRHSTNTKDEQDPANPYKRFPESKDYHRLLHLLWEREPVLFIEKSRTMMTSWWGVAEFTHYVQTNQPALGIFVAQDEDRAVKCIDYARILATKDNSRFSPPRMRV